MKTTPMRTNESAAGSTRLLHRLTAALLALVLAASAALPVFAADTAPTDTIYINSVSDLLAFADKCGFDQWSKGKTVILQEDLSLEDTEWAPVASFSGAFKGNGHTISDVSLVGAYSPAGFFGILEEGGSIQDLTIKGVVNPAGTQKTAGGLVGTNYGTIINCTFSGAVHGEEEAEKAQAAARAIFVGGGSHADMPSTDLSDEDFADGEIGILAMMVKGGLAASNGEARRLVQQGGVSINDEKITDPKFALKKSAFENEVILKKGKKVFHKFKY